MSQIIDLTKNCIGNGKFMQHAFVANTVVSTVLTDLLDTSCQRLYPIANFAMNNNFKHCHVYTT